MNRAGLAIVAVGVIVFFAGPLALSGLASLPSSYSGSQVIDLGSCTGGYAQGGCNQLAFAWNAPLMSPQLAAGVWNARFLSTPGYVPLPSGASCGFGALYQTNLPAYSPTQAQYIPAGLPSGVGSWFTVGSVVYLQSNSVYPCPSNVGLVNSGGTFTYTTATTYTPTSSNPTATTMVSSTTTSASTTSTTSTVITVSSTTTTLPPPPPSPVPPSSPFPFGIAQVVGLAVIGVGAFVAFRKRR